jgi:hypothetical protein
VLISFIYNGKKINSRGNTIKNLHCGKKNAAGIPRFTDPVPGFTESSLPEFKFTA